jgi:deoxyribose-phosphate aldolase
METISVTLTDIAKMIDHSLLHPTMTDSDLVEGCALAKKLDLASVCIKPYETKAARELLHDSDVMVCAVIGFPHGNSATSVKVFETQTAVQDGAEEIDMVVNIGKVIGGDWDYVSAEIDAINQATVTGNAILKVIFETDFLEVHHIKRLCEICSEIGVRFVKTSTGYGMVKQTNGMYSYVGATMEHLQVMRDNVSNEVQIKASGGVRTLDEVLTVRSLGVTRIGATASEAILEDAKNRGISDKEPKQLTFKYGLSNKK